MTLVKICGLSSEDMIAEAVDAGADRIGLVVIPQSVRFVDLDRARRLGRFAHALGAETWLVMGWRTPSAPRDDLLDLARDPAIDVVQLHTRETPQDVEAFRLQAPAARIVVALGVGSADDLAGLDAYTAADAFLFDARPPSGAALAGGHGRAFDPSFLCAAVIGKPWVLSGGLTPETVATAVRASGALEVDVSSGVERVAGVKDAQRMRAFVHAAKQG